MTAPNHIVRRLLGPRFRGDDRVERSVRLASILQSVSLAVCLLTLTLTSALTQQPGRPITLIVPYSPGTGIDILARTLGQKLTERWKVAVVVDNRPGASGNIGTEAVAKAPADGYTLLTTASTIVLNRSLFKSVPYDPVKDFAPVAPLAIGSLAFSKLLLERANVAVSPGIGFGEYGEGFVRIALVENRQRLRQAMRNIKTFLSGRNDVPELRRGAGDHPGTVETIALRV